MKKFVLFLSLIVFVGMVEAQIASIADINFESVPSGWTISPSNYWVANTDLYAGGHASYHGFVPIGNSGDTVIFTSPMYDFKAYKYAFLSFNQICKVSGSDICRIEYRENTMSSTWQVIPRSSYKGSGIYTNAMFHDGSYIDWMPGDSLAIPTNNWWKTEHFDISNEVSFAEVQFRFKITKGNVTGTHFAYGWLIDNFKLTASINPIGSPVVELISNYGDTVYNSGPFMIKAKVATRTYAPIINPKLYYSATFNNITTHDSIVMTAVEGDSIWTASIPQHLFGTSITFSIVGYDSVGNNDSVNSGFYLKRGGVHTVGYTYYYPSDTLLTNVNNSGIIFHINVRNSWSRSLYLASEIGAATQSISLTSLAWYNRAYYYANFCLRTNVNVYMKCTTATSNTDLTHEIPSTSGATLVYSGPIATSLFWNEIKLLSAFNVPAGSNLMIYFEDSSGVIPTGGGQVVLWSGHTDGTRTVYQYEGSGITKSTMAPLMRFGLGVVNDTHSVAMHSIDNPKNIVFVNPSAQIPIVVTIKNRGITNLDSCYIDWTLNGIPQGRHTWRGNLPDDFNAKDTIGYFSPSANQYDTIVAWVSMPNGVHDSTIWDDTLIRVSYGMSGLDLAFVSSIGDTVYTTGPFTVQASIISKTHTPLPSTINLCVKSTYNSTDSYDTLRMDSIGNNIYEAIIPQHVFGTDIVYSITLSDSLGNVCSIADGFYIERPKVIYKDSIMIGRTTVGSTNSSYPFVISADSAKTRSLYLSSQFGGTIDLFIAGIAFYTANTNAIYKSKQKIYLKAVSDSTLTSSGQIDPVADGATLVYSGSWTTQRYWNKFEFDRVFTLPKGMNLIVYLVDESGECGTTNIFWRYNNASTTQIESHYWNQRCNTTSTTNVKRFPVAMFYFGDIINNTNSVALHAINNPENNVLVNPTEQIPVVSTIKNKGIADLDSCYIDWTLNGVPQSRFIWKGHLPCDFETSDIIGYYSPRANQYDTIVVWTSLPNGVDDSTTYDDTLVRITYGVSGLDLAFVSSISDTVYTTGPFSVQASISSRTLTPLPDTISLNVKYTYKGMNTYDTLPMTFLGNNIYEAIIPQHVFGTDVNYSITLSDSLGNVCHIHNHYFIKHSGNTDSNSVALFAINSPLKGMMGGVSQPVQVTIKNKGIKDLDSCIINWTLNGIPQSSYIWKGNLPEDFNDIITIGNYIQRSNNYDSLTIWVSMPNGKTDLTTLDDTLSIISYGCLSAISGDVIIGTSSGADYSSIEEALFFLSKCLSGNVTLKLQNGTYNENWDFSNLSDIMGSHTLTITSESGNRDNVILKPASGVGVVVNNTDNLIIKDISIDNTASASYGVHFTGAANNIEFRNIYFKGDTSSTSAYAPIYKANGTGIVDDIRFIGNLIEGGVVGIYFYGGISTSVYGTNVIVDSNIITSQYSYGTYFFYTDFTSISHNILLSRTSNTFTSWNGMYSNQCNFVADGNKIHQRSTDITSPTLANIQNVGRENATGPSLFCNNELIGSASSSSNSRCLYLMASFLNVYNNSIYMDGSAVSRSIHIGNNANSVYDLKNNIIINNSSSGYSIDAGGTAPTLISDYNCLYSPSYVGRLTSNYSTLADWQTATSQDANSVSLSPSFIDVSTSLELSDYSPFIVRRLNSVMEDIKGDARAAYTTMGAYSSRISDGYNLAVTAILYRDNFDEPLLCYNDYSNIQVVLKNEGMESYDFSVDSVHLTLEVSGAINFTTHRLINKGSLATAQSDTFDITNALPITTAGIYYITTYLISPADTLYDNDTLRISYPIRRIQLPYDVDFSTSHVDFVQKQIAGNASWAVEADTGNMPIIAPVFGSGRLTFHSESNLGSISQVIFNGVNLLGTHLPKLEFWYAHDNANPTKRDYVAIKISTDGENTKLLDAVYRYNSNYTSPGWAHYSIDLSAYTNEACVSLILEGCSFGGGNQNIDRIRISSSSDISLTCLSPQLTNLVACNLSNISAKVILSNLTSLNMDFDLDTANIYFQIRGMDSIDIVYPLSGMFYGLEKDTIELSHNLDLSRNGVYDVLAYVDAIDDNPINDTVKRRLLINPDLLIQDIRGIDEVNCKQSGDSVYVSFKIVNIGNLTVNEFPLSLQINGVNVLTDTIYQHLEPGDYVNYTFAEPFIVPEVSYIQPYYMVKIQTGLSCDAQPSNNIKSIMACVDVGDVVDLKVLSIDNPLETPCDSGNRAVKVSVTLSNEGTVDITSSVLHVEVDSVGSILASFSEATASILAKSTTEHIFTQTYRVPNFNGNYTVKVFLETIANDKNTSNDTLSVNACAIYNDVSVSDITAVDWYLGQNQPNPAQTMTEIPYAIPSDGTVNVKIMSVSGQVLYQKEIQATAGNHSLVVDIDFLSNGIYYYSMGYAGRTIVKKMTVNK